MVNSMKAIKSIYFEDVTDRSVSWDAVYKEFGIAFRDEVKGFFSKGDVWEIKMFAFIVCLRGQMTCNNSGMKVNLIPGHVLIVLPGTIISECLMSPDFQCRVLCLSPEVFTHHAAETGFFDMMLRIKDNPVIHIDFNSDYNRLFDAYTTILTIKSKHQNQRNVRDIIMHLIECLLYEMLSGIPVEDNKKLRQAQGSKCGLFKRFVELIACDKGRLRSVKSYAEKLKVSPKYLTAVCRSLSDKSAHEWINEMVKREIERLLQYSDLSAKEIADLLGFPDASFFSKYVRQHFNHTALQYRALLRSASPSPEQS